MHYPYPIIDADGHLQETPPSTLDWQARLPAEFKSMAPQYLPFETGGGRVFMEGRIWSRPYKSRRIVHGKEVHELHSTRTGMWDPRVRLGHLDVEGIDVAVLFGGTMSLACSGVRDAKFGAALARVYNDWVAEFCLYAPTRFKGVGAAPLQSPEDAVLETERMIKDLGFVGLQVSSNVYGKNLDHPDFDPVFAELERLDAPACIHVAAGQVDGTTIAGGERFGTQFFVHAIGHPFEQMIAFMCMTAGGVFDRHPKLRAAYLEAGCAWLPFWLDRLDEHYEILGAGVQGKAEPSEYVRSGNCWFSCEVDEAAIGYVCSRVRDDRIVFASDYWHFDGKFPGAVKAIADRPELSLDLKRKLMGANAAALYKLPLNGN